jgi:hypothetical protein
MRLTTSNFIFKMHTCGYSPYVTSSPVRGWVCHLQLLLVLASTVILRSETSRTHDHILLSQVRDSPNLEGQVPIFISPRNRVARLYPQALGSLFVTSDTQDNGGGGVIYLQKGKESKCQWIYVCTYTYIWNDKNNYQHVSPTYIYISYWSDILHLLNTIKETQNNETVYQQFINFKKIYDSVRREATLFFRWVKTKLY